MGIVSRGFSGRRHPGTDLPPGQYLTEDFPVLSAGPTPRVPLERWEFTVTTETGHRAALGLGGVPGAAQRADHGRPALRHPLVEAGHLWQGVSLDTLFADVETAADYALVHSFGGYTTNLPLQDLLDGQAWVAFQYDGRGPGAPSTAARPGCWCRTCTCGRAPSGCTGITLGHEDEPGFWESLGYHNYGDPWREQRYWDVVTWRVGTVVGLRTRPRPPARWCCGSPAGRGTWPASTSTSA